MEDLLFFDGQPGAMALYEIFRDRVLEEIGETEIRAQKTQITFSNRHVFACVSRLRVRKKKELPPDYIVVTFGLRHELDSPRIDVKTEPYPNRWTHHVVIECPDEIDEELINWVREAYQFALEK